MDNQKSNILGLLKVELGQYGFTLTKSKSWFTRKRSCGVDYYALIFLDEVDGYTVSSSAYVRLEEIESIFHRTSGVDPKFQKDFFTIGIDFWRVYGEGGYRFHVDTSSESLDVGQRLSEIFHEKALQFYKQFSSLEEVDEILNTMPSEMCIYRPMPWLRASTGVIASKLVGRDNHSELAAFYRQQMGSISNGFYLPRFDALLMSLGDNHDGNATQ